MGCVGPNDTGDNSAPNLANYVDVKIGETFEHPGYCNYTTESSVNCGTNGEFQRAGNSDSGCTCRSLCTDGCRRKLCKRVSYSGNADECCRRGGPTYYMDGNIVRTCDPEYRRGSWLNHKCDAALSTYCKSGGNLFNDTCRAWVTTFQPVGQIDKSIGNGSVDGVILDVCNRPEYANNEECGCVVGANEIRTKLPTANNLPVQCMYNKCANAPRAYRTTPMLAPCNITNCSMDITDQQIVANDPTNFTVGFTQLCGSAVADETAKNPTGAGTDTDTTQQSFFQKYWIWIAVIVVIIIIIIILILVTGGSDTDKVTSRGQIYSNNQMYLNGQTYPGHYVYSAPPIKRSVSTNTHVSKTTHSTNKS
jgi:hypothetical protein